MATDTPVETASRTRRILSSLFLQVLVAAVLGILVGVLWPEFGAALKLLGDAFIRAIKMIIAPLVFCVVVTGIAKAGDLRSVGRIGLKALIYFEVVSTLALVLGLVLGNLVRPGDGLNVDPATLDSSAVEKKTGGAALPGVGGFLLHVVPESVVGAFADNQLLQVLLFAVLFGAALVHLGPTRAPLVLSFVEQAGEVIFKIVGYVMRLAPIAVFGSLAYLIGQYGLSSLVTYGKLIGVSYGAAALFIVLLALLLRVLTGLSLWAFVRYTRAEFVLAIGTASSESVMPRMMDKLRAAGCKPEAVGLVAAHRVLLQPRRRLHLPLAGHPVHGPGGGHRTDHRAAAHRAAGADADLQGHGGHPRLGLPGALGHRGLGRGHPGRRGRAAARRGPDHGHHAGGDQPARQLRGHLRRRQMGGRTRHQGRAGRLRREARPLLVTPLRVLWLTRRAPPAPRP